MGEVIEQLEYCVAKLKAQSNSKKVSFVATSMEDLGREIYFVTNRSVKISYGSLSNRKKELIEVGLMVENDRGHYEIADMDALILAI